MGRLITNCVECGQEVFDAERCDDRTRCQAYKEGYTSGLIDGLDRAYRLLETRVVREYRDLILHEKLRYARKHVCGLRGYDPMEHGSCPACTALGR